MEQMTVTDRIATNCAKFHQHCERKLNSRWKFGKIVFVECHNQLIYQWFGRLDGKTKQSKTFNLNFKQNYTKYDTGKPKDGIFAPSWAVDEFLNFGTEKIYHVGGEEYCLTMVRVRNLGNQKKCEITNRFKIRNGDEWELI